MMEHDGGYFKHDPDELANWLAEELHVPVWKIRSTDAWRSLQESERIDSVDVVELIMDFENLLNDLREDEGK